VFLAKQLGHGLFNQESVCLELEKDILRDFSLGFCCRPTKIIEPNIEPPIDIRMKYVVFVA
jgi:hypothetical protein